MAVSRRTVTVLFADVADSTPLGERLDPESLRRVMTRFFEQMSVVLERHGGTVEKFIGDAVMAVFGIPELHEDDGLRAVRAATELRQALAELNAELERELAVRIGIRVGVNTGEVVAGDGSGGQMLVTGDAVNVAKRLEEAARTGEILVGEPTRRLVENAVVLEPRDELSLKGKAEPLAAWNVLAVIEGASAYARRLDAPLIGREAELRLLRETFWAVRRLFEEVAHDQPLVVVMEDIHWAEPTLLDLLEYLGGWTHDAPILLLCLARADLLDERPGWLTQPGSGLLLAPLSDDESHALLDEIAQEWPLDAAARARIAEAAEGNPLYLEQMAAMLAEGGPADTIPPSIHALIAARLDRLPAHEREVLECAAVAGKHFARSALRKLAPDADQADVDTRLLSLARKDLLAAQPGREDAYRFRHALIRDAAYAGIAKEQRAVLHERFADWAAGTSAGRFGELDEIVGYHYEQAFRYREQLGPLDEHVRTLAERAAEMLGAAGRRAYARDDMPAAINLLDRAVALASEEEPAQLVLRRELSNALWSVGELARAEALLDGLIEAAEEAGDRHERWHGLLERSGRLSITHPEAEKELLETAERAIEIFAELGDDLGLARAWRRVSAVRRLRCHFADASEAAKIGLAHARSAGAAQEEARLVDELCSSLLFGPARADEAIARCE